MLTSLANGATQAAGTCWLHVKLDTDTPVDCGFTYADVTTAASNMVVQCAAEKSIPSVARVWTEDGSCKAGVKFCESNEACFPR